MNLPLRLGRIGVVALMVGCAVGAHSRADVSAGIYVGTSTSVYTGAGYYDPWYWGPNYAAPTVIGPPPPTYYSSPGASVSVGASRTVDRSVDRSAVVAAPRPPAISRGGGRR